MLQKLNERIQGIVAWLVILLIAITFTLFGVDYYLQKNQVSNIKVLVNSEPISNQTFEDSYKRVLAQQDSAHLTAVEEKNIQAQVLNQLITTEVTVQSAHQYGFGVSSNQANEAIVQIAQFQEDGRFSNERYRQALSAAQFTPDAFNREIRQGMLLNQQRFAFMGSSFALPNEINNFVRLYMQTRDYDYLTVSSAALAPQIQVSDSEVKKYYKDHQDEFMSPERVSIDYVTLSMRDIRDSLKINDEDIARYYSENQSNYMTPAQWKVAHILFAVPKDASTEEEEQIKSKAQRAYKKIKKDPAQFNILLTQSDDKVSIADHGIMPWLVAGQNDYDKFLSNLTTVGQISTVKKTAHGYEIFKLVEYKPVKTKTLEEVKNTIHEQLAVDQAQTQYGQRLERLSDLSYQSPDSLQPVADELGLKLKHSSLFPRNGGDDSVTKNKQVISAAFSNDVLDLGNNSDPIQLDNDSVVVLRVTNHEPTKKLTYEQVSNEIKTLLAKQFANAKAKEIGTQLLASDIEKQNPLMNEYHLKWVGVDNASRDNEKSNSTINDLAFSLSKEESRDGVVLDNGDYTVVRLKKINTGNLDALDKDQQESLSQQVESSFGVMDYDLYVSGLLNIAKIEHK